MKLDAEPAGSAGNRVESYGPGRVTIGGTAYFQSLLILPGEPVRAWPPSRFEELLREHFEIVAGLSPELVLLGTGRNLRFPPAALLTPLHDRQVGVEVMDTGAVCRAFNFLAGEGRRVAAALLMIEA